jgi:hypothetical protein
LRPAALALHASLLSSIFAGAYLLLTDAELWTVAPDHAYGLAAMVGADLLMLAALLSRKVGARGLQYISVAGVVKLVLILGDVLTAPQFGLGYAEFASYLFSLWAYDLLIVSQVGVAASAYSSSRMK